MYYVVVKWSLGKVLGYPYHKQYAENGGEDKESGQKSLYVGRYVNDLIQSVGGISKSRLNIWKPQVKRVDEILDALCNES